MRNCESLSRSREIVIFANGTTNHPGCRTIRSYSYSRDSERPDAERQLGSTAEWSRALISGNRAWHVLNRAINTRFKRILQKCVLAPFKTRVTWRRAHILVVSTHITVQDNVHDPEMLKSQVHMHKRVVSSVHNFAQEERGTRYVSIKIAWMFLLM